MTLNNVLKFSAAMVDTYYWLTNGILTVGRLLFEELGHNYTLPVSLTDVHGIVAGGSEAGSLTAVLPAVTVPGVTAGSPVSISRGHFCFAKVSGIPRLAFEPPVENMGKHRLLYIIKQEPCPRT